VRRSIRIIFAAVLGGAGVVPAHAAALDRLEEIVISASLRAQPLRELPRSVTVLDRATLAEAGVQHF
jgi:outer membrane receptor protein involved in Fe transport